MSDQVKIIEKLEAELGRPATEKEAEEAIQEDAERKVEGRIMCADMMRSRARDEG